MKNNDNEIKSVLKKFIVKNYLLGAEDAILGDDDSFLGEGIIDSIGVIELVRFIEARYGIKTKPAEIVPDNFDTLNDLVRYINKKLKV